MVVDADREAWQQADEHEHPVGVGSVLLPVDADPEVAGLPHEADG